MTVSTIEYALMAGASYFDTRGSINRVHFPEYSGWGRLSGGMDHRAIGTSGFEATAYQRGSEIVISFAGTYLPQTADVAADIALGVGFIHDQLYQAARYYQDIKRSYPGANITFTGHSLGGGLAALMGVFFNKTAFTFDQAPFRSAATIENRDYLLNRFEDEAYGIDPDLQSFDSFTLPVPNSPDIVMNVRGENNITALSVNGEFLSALSPLRLGNELPSIQHGGTFLNPLANSFVDRFTELHSIDLLIALQHSHKLRQASQTLSFLLGNIFDEALFYRPTDPSNETEKDFLANLIRYEFGNPGETGSKLELLTKFGNDASKLASFASAGDSITEPLLKILMNYYYEKEESIQVPMAEPGEFFVKMPGGLQFDLTQPMGETALADIKGYADLRNWLSLNTDVTARPLVDAFLADARRITLGLSDNLYAQVPNDSVSDFMWAGTSGFGDLAGNGGNDLLVGGQKSDWLAGGSGNDTLIGAGGNDRYDFYRGEGNDTIIDAQGEDKLYIDGNLISHAYHEQGDDANTFKFHQGNVTFIFLVSGADLLITRSDSSDQITIKNFSKENKTLGIELGAPSTIGYNGSLLSDIYHKAVAWFDSLGTNGSGGTMGGGGGFFIPSAYAEADIVDAGNYLERNEENNEVIFLNNQVNIQSLIEGVDGIGNSSVGGTWRDGDLGDDIVVGDASQDNLLGGLGSDIVIGGDGNDVLFGDYTNRELVYRGSDKQKWSFHHYGPNAQGQDYVYDDNGVDTYVLYEHDGSNDGNDLIDGGDGGDAIEGNGGDDVLLGGYGNDFVGGHSGNDYLSGGAGDDQLFGDYTPNSGAAPMAAKTYNDILDGGAGNDALEGGYGDDQLFGGVGDDILQGDVHLFGLPVTLELRGGDYLDGGDGDDMLFGGGGSDTLLGGEGSDRLQGDDADTDSLLIGNDYLDGGAGNDSIGGSGGSDTLYGGSGDDALAGDADNEPISLHGDDYLDGSEGNDLLRGYGGNDYLIGGEGNDVIDGDEGSDIVFGGRGSDVLRGGSGRDTFIFSIGDGEDLLDDFDGDEIVISGASEEQLTFYRSGGYLAISIDGTNDILWINNYFDTSTGELTPAATSLPIMVNSTVVDQAAIKAKVVAGTDYAQYIVGFSDNETIDALGGNDTVFGLAGDDVISGGLNDDTLQGGEGSDSLYGDEGNDTLYAEDQFSLNDEITANILDGGSGNDGLYGAGGADTLFGGAGDDELAGNTGDDILAGGSGSDLLRGGDGNDTYVFETGGGTDTIDDASGSNRLAIDAQSADIMAIRLGSNDIVIKYGTNDAVLIKNGQVNLNSNVQSIDKVQSLAELLAIYDAVDSDGYSPPHDIPSSGIHLIGIDGSNTFAVVINTVTFIDSGSSSGMQLIALPDGMTLAEFKATRIEDNLTISAINGKTVVVIEDFYSEAQTDRMWTIGGTGSSESLTGWIDEQQTITSSFDEIIGQAKYNFNVEQYVALTEYGERGYLLSQAEYSSEPIKLGRVSEYGVNRSFIFSGVTDAYVVAPTGGEQSVAYSTQQLTTSTEIQTIIKKYYVPTYKEVVIPEKSYTLLIEELGSGWYLPPGTITHYIYDANGVPTAINITEPRRIEWRASGVESYTYEQHQAINDYTLGYTVQHLVGNNTTISDYMGTFRGTIELGDGNNVVRVGAANPHGQSPDWGFEGWSDHDYGGLLDQPGAFIQAGNGNNLLQGTRANDIFAVGTGYNRMAGGGGDDIYYVQMMDSSSSLIFDSEDSTSARLVQNTLVLPEGVDPTDLSYTWVNDSNFAHYANDRMLVVSVGDSTVRILTGSSYGRVDGIQRFQFHDGTVLTLDQLLEVATETASGEDASAMALNQQVELQGSIVATELVSVAAPNGSAVLWYQFVNSTQMGYFTVDGERHNRNVPLFVRAEDLSTVRYVGETDTLGATDQIKVSVFDGEQWSPFSMAQLTTVSANNAPSIGNLTLSSNEDAPLHISVNDLIAVAQDADGDSLSIVEIGGAAHGTVEWNTQTGVITFTPDANYHGSASFSYTVSDGVASAIGVAIITVNAINDVPTAQAIAFDADAGTPLQITAANLLAGVNDMDGDTLSIVGVANPTHGTVTWDAQTGIVTFTPQAGFDGAAHFGYLVSDGISTTEFSADITVNPAADSLQGTSGDDALIGTVANDVLTGFAGNDLLDGGVGADTLIGGEGDDSYVVDNAGDVVVESLDEGMDSVSSSVDYILGDGLETLTLTGSSDLLGGGNNADNLLIGNSGNNTLSGFDGEDVLFSGDGIDTLIGGIGYDAYIITNSADVIIENADEGDNDAVISLVSFALPDHVESLTLMEEWMLQAQEAAFLEGLLIEVNASAIGNSLDNFIQGNSSHNYIDGAVGADTMAGGIGDDTYVVDNVDDIVTESASEGVDSVSSSVSYTLAANIENLTLTGTAALNGTGNSGANILTGNSGINTLTGMAGDDVLNGGAGADRMVGGTGNDTYFVDAFGDAVIENAGEGIDTVNSTRNYTLSVALENLVLLDAGNINGTGNSLSNTLMGNSGDNSLAGGAGDDVLLGGAGNDRLNGQVGADTMIGGVGNDTYFVDDINDQAIELAGEGYDSVSSAVDYTLGTNFEQLWLSGIADLNGIGNELNNYLSGNEGINTLSGLAGNDALYGGAGNDILFGDAGNDQLNGQAGADTMIGGVGNDTYFVDDINDQAIELAGEGYDSVSSAVDYTLGTNFEQLWLSGIADLNGIGNELNNYLSGNEGINTLSGLAGNDALYGGAGNDILFGDAGNDQLNGQADADTMIGGVGDDGYMVDNASDVITEMTGEGFDTVGTTVDYTLGETLENLWLAGTGAINGTGNAQSNTLWGNDAANTLSGMGGTDWLYAAAGNDVLLGDAGNDYLNGDAGADTLMGGMDYDDLSGGLGNDTYVMGRGDGQDVIRENDSTLGNTDVLSFLSGVANDQLWFRHVGNNLEVSIIGTSDKTAINNWYSGNANHVEQFKTADGKVLLDSQVENLVNAMAAFAPPSAGQTTLPQNYQDQLGAVIAANWQ